jgi:hypothetical protein
MKKGDLTAVILRLAATGPGCHSSDPALNGWTTQQVCVRAGKLIDDGRLHRVKFAHRNVRYYATKAQVDHVLKNLRVTSKAPAIHRQDQAEARNRADWANAEMVITDKTVFTQCPGYQPRFQEIELPRFYGGNQRGRVTA